MLIALHLFAYVALLTTSSIVRDRVQLTICRSTTAASPFSPVPISRCRRLTLPITDRLRSSAHVPMSAVSLRSSSCCTGHAYSRSRRSLTNWRPCVKFDVAFMHCIASYRIAIFWVISIVSYRFHLGPYRANTTAFGCQSHTSAASMVYWTPDDNGVNQSPSAMHLHRTKQ